MSNHTLKLLGIQLRNFFGINEAIYSKDKQKKSHAILMAASFLLLGIVLVGYIISLSYGLCFMGMGDLLPSYMLLITSLLTFFFTTFKTNGVIFQTKNYEMLVSLPIKPSAIVASRFLNMYVSNLLLVCVTMLPSSITYGIFERPGFSFYAFALMGVLIIPLIPMTLATTVGAIITMISVRVKYSNLVNIVLSFSFLFGLMAFCYNGSDMQTADVMNMAGVIGEQINHIYPLAPIFNDAMINGSFIAFLQFTAISIGVYLGFVYLVSLRFVSVCAALNAHTAKKNYKIGQMVQNSPVKALYKKELKRYFASSLYVFNTSFGAIAVVIMAIAIAVMGVEQIETLMNMPGIFSKALPFALALMGTMSCTSVCSISMEGKQWWLPKSLPMKAKDIFDSKILVNLTITLPATLLACIILAIALPLSGLQYVWIFLVPFIYNLFIAVIGITVNARLFNFNWENDAVVIKQSSATLVGMLIGFISVAIPAVLVIVFGTGYDIIMLAAVLVIAVLTILFYHQNNRLDLRKIG